MSGKKPSKPSVAAKKPGPAKSAELSTDSLDKVTGGAGAPPAPHGPVGPGG
jgi:hypothetical protein